MSTSSSGSTAVKQMSKDRRDSKGGLSRETPPAPAAAQTGDKARHPPPSSGSVSSRMPGAPSRSAVAQKPENPTRGLLAKRGADMPLASRRNEKAGRFEQRDVITVEGYITGITQIQHTKDKKGQYFNFWIEREKGNLTRGVSYDLGKHAILCAYRENGKAVRLENVKLLDGGFYRTVSENTVKVDGRTIVHDVVHPLSFLRTKGNHMFKTLLQIHQAEVALEDAVCVEVKVVGSVGEPKKVVCYGEEKECQHLVIADATGSMRLVVWETFVGMLKVGMSYCLTDLKLRVVNGFQLTTSKMSASRPVSDLENAVKVNMMEYAQAEGEKAVVGEITAAAFNTYRCCVSCKRKIVLPDAAVSIVSCQMCGIRQKVRKCGQFAVANVVFDIETEDGTEETKDLSIPKEVLLDMLGRNPPFGDEYALSDMLLALPRLEVVYDTFGSRVLTFKRLDG